MHWDHEHHCKVRKRHPDRIMRGMRWEWYCINPECNYYGAEQYWKRAVRGALEHVYLMRLVEQVILGKKEVYL